MDVLPVRPSPDSVMAVPSGVQEADSGPAEQAPRDAALSPAPAAPSTQVFSACQEGRLVGCDALYVRMVTSDPDLCVQLVMDNCNANTRQGLSVTLPLSWRFASGSASTNRGCDLREYDAKSEPVLEASGSVRWALRSGSISGLQVDVRLHVDPAVGSKVPAEIDVVTSAPIGTVESCD